MTTSLGTPRPPGTPRPLGLDEDALVACVACGLCLPHCPTYRVTGLEIASPRGRIAAMRAVESGAHPVGDELRRALDECVQCRGCEAACPSSVPYGRLVEQARAALHDNGTLREGRDRPPGRARRAAEWLAYRVVLPYHVVLLALTWVLWLAQRLRVLPRRLAVPRLRAGSLRKLDVPVGGEPDAWLFTGCVMDAWLRDTHRSAATVMRATGAAIARPARGGDCCGALHLHAGRARDARALAGRVIASMPGDAPVVVDSAGCGAAMKEYGRLLGTPEAHAFAARVRDFSEWLATTGVPPLHRTGEEVVVQDPCHLRHVQRAHVPVRTVLAGAYDLVETDDDGLCCGAGGAYSLLQPALATAIRDRKVDAVERAAPGAVVVSANPGCMLHLAAAGLDVRHPADLVAGALSPSEGGAT